MTSNPSETSTIVLVGHCGPDNYLLRSAVKSAVPEAVIASAVDDRELAGSLATAGLLLVNRVLEGGFADGSGINLIRRLRKQPNPPALMLVSNYEDAQVEAVESGARPGFGKSGIFSEVTAGRIRDALRAPPAIGIDTDARRSA